MVYAKTLQQAPTQQPALIHSLQLPTQQVTELSSCGLKTAARLMDFSLLICAKTPVELAQKK